MGGPHRLVVEGRQGRWGSAFFLSPLSCVAVLYRVFLLEAALFPWLWWYSSPPLFFSQPFWWWQPNPLHELSLHPPKILGVRFPQGLSHSSFILSEVFSQHLVVMTLKFMSIVDLFPEFQVQVSNCLLHNSSWMFHRHPKLKISKSSLIFSLPKLVFILNSLCQGMTSPTSN